MDAISQATLGAAIGEAAFRRKLGPKAVYVGALAAFAVDIDIFAGIAGRWASVIYHRALTHSVFVLLLLTPLVGWLGWRWTGRNPEDRTGTWRQWSLLAGLALITHPILDLFTSWGTQLLWPFSDRRFAIDGIFIVDAFYTLPMIAVLALAVIKSVPRDFSVRFARGVLVFTTLYLLVGTGLSLRAESIAAKQLEAEGFEPVAVRAVPTFSNILVWHVVARDANDTVAAGTMSLVASGKVAFNRYERPDDPLVEKALSSEHGQVYRWLADGYVHAEVERTEDGGSKVWLRHMGFGFISDPTFSPFPALAVFDSSGTLTGVELPHRRGDLAVGRELSALWRVMWTGT